VLQGEEREAMMVVIGYITCTEVDHRSMGLFVPISTERVRRR